MTYEQFLRELQRFKGRFYLTPKGCIRNKRLSDGYCPIAAMEVARGGENTGYGSKVKLDTHIRARIMCAADNETRSTTPTRKDLLRVLGLKEKGGGG